MELAIYVMGWFLLVMYTKHLRLQESFSKLNAELASRGYRPSESLLMWRDQSTSGDALEARHGRK